MKNTARQITIPLLFTTIFLISCNTTVRVNEEEVTIKHHVIFDTDANSEIDDQHALAYLLLSGDVFAVEGVTVNATTN